jgi:hypothetical protein
MKKTNSLILLLILIGCVPFGEQSSDTFFSDQTYRTGREGLSINFMENMPPTQIYSREPFTALIEITNNGASAVGNTGDRVYLSGFDTTIIQGIPNTGIQIPKIEGRSQYIRNPEMDMVMFRGTVRDISNIKMEKYRTNIVATACYTYETIANTGICIDPDPTSITKQKACNPETKFLGTQGAPIAVNEIEVIPSKAKTIFRIHIKNEGYGDVFKNGINYLQKCSPYSEGLSFDEVDYVELGDVIVSGTNIKQSCKPKDNTGHIRLTNRAATIICELTNIPGQTAYTTPMSITLRYGYRNAIFKNFEILAPQ